MYVQEFYVRYRLRRIRTPRLEHSTVQHPSAAARLLTAVLGREVVEVCGVLCLTARLDVIAYHELSRGTLTQTLVCPRDVCRTALLVNAAVVVIGHNHPSGDPTPSPDDTTLTTRLAAATQVLGIDLADHVIVTADGRYVSFKEMGHL